MPSIKDFEKDKKKKRPHKKPESHLNGSSKGETVIEDADEDESVYASQMKTEKRRPSHIKTSEPTPGQMEADVADNAGEPTRPEASEPFTSGTGDDVGPNPESFQSFSEAPRFELNFPGSFLVKAKVPKTFELAERIAGEWISDGTFESLPVGHPLAQILASKALLKAKSIEKNVLNSTPVALAKIGLEYAKSKIKR